MAELNAVQTAVSDLEIGMYVSALDRPWIDTPFLVQGFYITSQQDIEALEKHCKFVFVDVYRSKLTSVRRSSRIIGVAGEARPLSFEGPAEDAGQVKFRPRSQPVGPMLFPHRKLKKYDDTATLEQELPQAKAACKEMAGALAAMSEGYRQGGALDISGVRAAVDPLLDSMIRNPDACVWLARMKSAASYSDRHALAVAIWALALGRNLGLPRIDLQRLALGAALFDVGKLRLPLELLHKRERLTPVEFEQLKSHVDLAMEMLQKTGVMNRTVADMVESHHERHGGHGYPRGLRGNDIPVFARIAALVDCYDAITSHRPYSKPMSPSTAVKQMYAWRDVDFQAELVEEFIQAVGIYPAGTLVELSNGEVGVVLSGYRTRRLRPLLLRVLDSEKKPVANVRPLDLHGATNSADGKPLEIVTSLEPGAYGIDPEEMLI